MPQNMLLCARARVGCVRVCVCARLKGLIPLDPQRSSTWSFVKWLQTATKGPTRVETGRPGGKAWGKEGSRLAHASLMQRHK